jgi:hypothetical protein
VRDYYGNAAGIETRTCPGPGQANAKEGLGDFGSQVPVGGRLPKRQKAGFQFAGIVVSSGLMKALASENCTSVLKALADETRWSIVQELLFHPLTANELAEQLRVSSFISE